MAGLFGGGSHTSTSDTKLTSFHMQTATYGLPVPIILGTTRVSGNLIDYVDFTATPHTQTQETGKGGGSSTSNTSYTYSVGVAIGIGEGEIVGIRKVWKGKEIKTLQDIGLNLIQNTRWLYMMNNHPERALVYPKFAYVAGYIDLGGSDSLPNISLEVSGQYLTSNSIDGFDCHVSDVFTQMLTNKQWGLALDPSLLDNWTRFKDYCQAAGIFFSYNMSEAVATNSLLEDMIKTTNSEFVVSEGKLKIATYCEQEINSNGTIYKPDLTIQYYFDDDSIISDDDEPAVKIKRVRYDDTYNSVSLEILNRGLDYNIDSVEWSDPTDTAARGAVSGSSISAHWLVNRDIATMIARLLVWRKLYNRNTYVFTVPDNYYLLEPMDIVALTDTRLSLYQLPVRIKKITEDERGLNIEAEDCFKFTTSPVFSSSGTPVFSAVDQNVPAGNINLPVVILASPTLSLTGSYEAWIAVSGDNTNWGGCSVYISYDNVSYAKIGIINNPSRHGTLTDTLPTNLLPLDNVNTLKLKTFTGQLLSGTANDRDILSTLLYVDGELMSYQNATLVSANTYDITSLRRGVYGSTIGSHNGGTQWARLDSSIFKHTFNPGDLGKKMYLKFTSFNIFGRNEQLLSDVIVYPFTATATGAYMAPPVVNDTTPSTSGVYSSQNVDNRLKGVNDKLDVIDSQLGDISSVLTSIIGG